MYTRYIYSTVYVTNKMIMQLLCWLAETMF